MIDLGTAPTAGGPRLLAGWVATHGRADLTAHVARYGPLPDPAGLIGVVEAAGLRGRGGAWFPTATKLRAVAGGRRAGTVVGNGVDAEPASDKDNVLLTVAPHLVLDGGVLAAAEVGARDVVVCVRRGAPLVGAVIAAIRQRADPVPVRVAEIPARYVASEESALAHYLTTGEARPTDRPPPVSERGVRGRPTLVDNVETLADIALIARYGADWFRAVGTPSAPGTALVTTGGAVARPGVSEVPVGAAISAVCAVSAGVRAVLVGGFGGVWVPAAADLSIGPEVGGSVRAVHVRAARGVAGRGRARGRPGARFARARAVATPTGRGRRSGRLCSSRRCGATRAQRADGVRGRRGGACAWQAVRRRRGIRRAGAGGWVGGDHVVRRLRVNPIACRAHGLCAELLPELVDLDEWGYPMLPGGTSADVPPGLVDTAREAVGACPTLALRITGPVPR